MMWSGGQGHDVFLAVLGGHQGLGVPMAVPQQQQVCRAIATAATTAALRVSQAAAWVGCRCIHAVGPVHGGARRPSVCGLSCHSNIHPFGFEIFLAFPGPSARSGSSAACVADAGVTPL